MCRYKREQLQDMRRDGNKNNNHQKIRKMSQLPTLAELHHDVQAAFKNDKLNLLLNQPPHISWIKKHPLIKVKDDQGNMVPLSYLPIDKVEFLLTRIFQEWRVEIISYAAVFQSVSVHVRLHYKNPLTGEWNYQDGIGASPVQTDAGKSAADLGAIKSGAVQMALPSAESYAIKDAAEKLGTLFGKDLNRRDTVQFAGAFFKPEEDLQGGAPPPAIKQLTQQEIHENNNNWQPAPTATATAPLLFNANDL